MFSIYDLKQTERSALVDEEHNVYLSAFPDDFLNKLDISNEDRENFIIGYLWTENPKTNVNNNESIFLIEVIDKKDRYCQVGVPYELSERALRLTIYEYICDVKWMKNDKEKKYENLKEDRNVVMR